MTSLPSSAISIAVPDWDITLRSQALLSETPMEDKVKATFDLIINPVDMNNLFEWNTSGTDGKMVKFKTGATTNLEALLKKQVYIPTGQSRGGETVSLATHFLCSHSYISLSGAMASTDGISTTANCNMIEEKILSVSEDIFNSTSAFTLFEPNSRLLLANDYYNSGREALKYLFENKFTNTVATGIYQNLSAYRETTTGATDFGEFEAGDELTFNVIAVSSLSQYEITPTANRNLMDRSYKFRIVASSLVSAYHGNTISNGTGVSSALASSNAMGPFLGQYVMGHTTGTQYMTIFNNYAGITNSVVGSIAYVDPRITVPKIYATRTVAEDGSSEF
jgi:hypothetical protein